MIQRAGTKLCFPLVFYFTSWLTFLSKRISRTLTRFVEFIHILTNVELIALSGLNLYFRLVLITIAYIAAFLLYMNWIYIACFQRDLVTDHSKYIDLQWDILTCGHVVKETGHIDNGCDHGNRVSILEVKVSCTAFSSFILKSDVYPHLSNS